MQAGIQQCGFLSVEPRDGSLPDSRSSIASSSLLVDCHHRGPSAISISRPHRQGKFPSCFRSPGREARSHGPPKPLELAIINAVVTRLSRLTPSEPCRAPSPPSPPHIGPAGCAINHHPQLACLRCRSAFLPALWPVLRSTRKLVGWLGWLRVALFAPILGVAVACQWRL